MKNSKKPLSTVDLVVFDLDDTLYLERDYVISGFYAVDEFLQSCGVNSFFTKACELFEQGKRGNVFDLALDALGAHADQALISKLVEVYRGHSPSISLLPDARRALNFFATKRRLALLSDGYLEVQEKKVDALRIEQYFQGIFLSDRWGRACWKPSHCVYEKIEGFFGVNNDSCIYISDNPSKDFVAPNQRGWRSLQIVRDGGVYSGSAPVQNGKPEGIIHSLDELPQLFNSVDKEIE